jgi:hypothetical protein
LKTFILFGFCDYYPSGGIEDYLGDFDTLEEAEKIIDFTRFDNFQIFNQESKEYTDYRINHTEKQIKLGSVLKWEKRK